MVPIIDARQRPTDARAVGTGRLIVYRTRGQMDHAILAGVTLAMIIVHQRLHLTYSLWIWHLKNEKFKVLSFFKV